MLCLLAGALAWGCLDDAPPERFETPQRTAPLLFLDRAVPPNTRVLTLSSDSPAVSFTVPVQSEDLGETLRALLWVNFGREDEEAVVARGETPAGNFQDPGRSLTLHLDPSRLPSGCVLLTLVVQHDNNFDNATPGKPLDYSMASMATWWAVVNADPAEVSFADCGGTQDP